MINFVTMTAQAQAPFPAGINIYFGESQNGPIQ